MVGVEDRRHDENEAVDLEKSRTFAVVRRFIPSTTEYDGQKLFTRVDGKRLATPLFAVLVLVETTDVVFAVDSVPAVLAVAREQFIVFSSNAFAILGLRSMYFLLAGAKDRFRYLNVGLGIILASVGIKMLLSDFVHLPAVLSLGIIVSCWRARSGSPSPPTGGTHGQPARTSDEDLMALGGLWAQTVSRSVVGRRSGSVSLGRR